MERAVRKRGSRVANTSPSNRPLREQRGQEGRGGRALCGLRNRGRARKCGARLSRLENENGKNLSLSTESRKGFAIAVVATGVDVKMDSLLSRAAQ